MFRYEIGISAPVMNNSQYIIPSLPVMSQQIVRYTYHYNIMVLKVQFNENATFSLRNKQNKANSSHN